MNSTSVREEEEERREAELIAAQSRVQVGLGPPVATAGHPTYDETPMDLSLGLHFSTETRVVEYDDGPDSDIMRAFRDLERSFQRTSPYGVDVWLQLSLSTTLTERTLGLTPIPLNANFDYTNKLEGAAACTGRFRTDCCQPG
ncbi:hypothetical protein JADG_010923 [Aureobasidium aubasidani]|nr:hypothetical protein JADG_010923 [Aureobasidium pullulans]